MLTSLLITLLHFYNYVITTSKFYFFLKMVNVIPTLKKEVKKEETFEPVSISFIYFLEKYPVKFNADSEKGYSTQHSLLLMLEK